MGGLQHGVVIAVDRDVGVDVAVTGMHVQSHPHPAFEHTLVNGIAFGQHRAKRGPRENGLQRRADLGFPAGTQAVILQLRKQRIHIGQPTSPERAHLPQQSQGLLHTVAQQLGTGNVVGIVCFAQRQIALLKKSLQCIAQRQLVAQTQLNVDALDAIGVLGHAGQRNHHILIHLEGVGVLADGRCALAIQPEFFAGLGADGHKAFATAAVGNAHHLAGGTGHGIGIVAHDVPHQHHFGHAGRGDALALGGIAHRLQVAVVQMLQTRQQHAGAFGLGKHEVFDFDNAGHSIAGIAKKLQTHRAGVCRHAVDHPAGAGNQAIAAFFLDARQAAQELVGHVFAQTFFAEAGASDVQPLGTDVGFSVGLKILQLKAGGRNVVNLAQVVVEAGHLQPLRIRGDHAPAGQVVQRCAPQNGFFAARVHGDVAAHATGLGTGGINGKHIARALGSIGHPLGDHTGLGPHCGHRVIDTRQLHGLDLGHGLQLFGVDDCALPGERNGTAGIARTTSTRDDGQPKLDTTLDQTGHFSLGVRCEHHKRVLHTPIGGIGYMADPAQAIELDVVFGGAFAQRAHNLLAQFRHVVKLAGKPLDGITGSFQQLGHQDIALGIVIGSATLLHLGQAVVQGIDQLATALGVVQQVVLQIGVALHHPDIAHHFIEHAG